MALNRVESTMLVLGLLFGVFFVSTFGLGAALIETAKENAALKQDLMQAQARLDEFYGPAENVVNLDGAHFKAVSDLGRTDSGYLVLTFSRIDFTEMCQAGFREVANDTSEKVGKPFLCPTFEQRR